MELQKEQLFEIFNLLTAIENLGDAVFIDYIGHVKILRVRIYENGWGKDKEPEFLERMYIDIKHCCGKSITVEGLIEGLRNYYKKLENKKEADKKEK